MNKLSDCELFQLVDKHFRGSIVKTLKKLSENVNKYVVEKQHYDFMVKSMRSYRYPLSKLVVKSSMMGEIKPMLLNEPKDKKDDPIYLPSTIPTMSSSNGVFGFVDISPRASYTRNNMKQVESLKMKEIDLYAFLQMAFLEAYLKRYSSMIDRSNAICKNVAIAYSRLFSKCIDRNFPISSKIETFNVSIFLSSVFCLVNFFDYRIKDAINFVFSSKICDKSEIESECKVLREDKLNFKNLSEFLEMYNYEFDVIKDKSLKLRTVVNMFQKMYGANSWFGLEHAGTFFNMILAVPIGFYNDKYISKTVKAQVDKINKALVTTFSK